MQWQVVYDPPLSLTMYRELAAHVEQIEGITTVLFPPTLQTFDYAASQVGGIILTITDSLPPDRQGLVESILAHYGLFTKTSR